MPTQRVEIDAQTVLAVQFWGAPSTAVPVFCWHMLGGGQSGKRFAGLARRLAALHGLQVLAIDAPGFGESPVFPPERYRPSLLADLVPRLLDALEIERVDFVGASWGGTVGCFVAERHADRLRRLVLLDVGYQAPMETAPLEIWIAHAAGRDDGVRADLRGAILWGVALEPPSAAQLARTGLPVLLLTATEPEVDDEAIAAFRAELPAADVRAIPGASHDVVGDAEADVAPAIGAWLSADD